MDTNNFVLSQEEAEQMLKEDMEFVTALYGSDYVNKMIANTQSEAKIIDDAMNKRIVQIRKSKKISQIELAKKAGISVNSLRLYEAGKRSPTFATLQKIAAALGVSWYELLSDDPGEQAEEIKTQMKEKLSSIGNASSVIVHHAPLFEISTDDLGRVIELALANDTAPQVSKNRLEKIVKDYGTLNDEGQKIAVERIHELTEISRYKRKSTPEE